MFDELTVAENIFMGHMPGGRFINWGEMRRRGSHLLERIEADFDATAPLKQLSVAQKHMVEIARALSHEASVIIMDGTDSGSVAQRNRRSLPHRCAIEIARLRQPLHIA